jgi:flagellin-like hook-associated protein FlgL
MTTIKFGANITAARLQRNLGIASEGFTAASQRLASGQRINRPSDDAAGLAITATLNANTRVLSQAVRNLNDGLSSLGIAEAAMDSLNGILGRLSELTTQAMSSTYGSTQRSSMQQEITALQSEWNRIVESTTYNGSTLLTGSTTRTVLQGGKGDVSTLAVQVGAGIVSEAFGLQSSGATTRISITANGTQADDASIYGTISGDGSVMAFDSFATTLVSGASNRQVYVKDAATGVVTVASQSASGAIANADSREGKLSTDGRFIVFQSGATNLISGVSGEQIYLKNLSTGALQLASSSSSGVAGNATSMNFTVSGDGRYVTFFSTATNLISGVSGSQVYVKDMQSGILQLASQNSSGVQGNGTSDRPVISDDGRYVVFESSSSNLVTGTSGTQTFVKDMVTGQVRVASSNAQGVYDNGGPFQASLNATGRYVAFSSSGDNLLSGLSGSFAQIFLKDMSSGILTLVTTTSSGTEANGSSYDATLSADGRYIAFRSNATNLISGVGAGQIYRKDLQSGALELVSRSTSGAPSASDSYVGDKIKMTSDGRKILFHTVGSNIVSGDSNGYEDVFLRDMSKAGIQQLAGIVVTDIGNARASSGIVNQYREELLLHRSSLGAANSRIGSFLATISATKVNYQEAEARILDVDVAQEVASATAAKIRQDIGAALLSQASGISNLALRLISVG